MQESMNKDLEELKNKHTETNNIITESKNSLEWINSRISEAEERISELEDNMVEITSEEQNKVKRIKISEDNLWENIRHNNTWIIGVPEEEKKKKGYEKIFGDYSWKFPQHGKGNSQSSPRGTKSPIKDKAKEKHAKTHTNQTNRD